MKLPISIRLIREETSHNYGDDYEIESTDPAEFFISFNLAGVIETVPVKAEDLVSFLTMNFLEVKCKIDISRLGLKEEVKRFTVTTDCRIEEEDPVERVKEMKLELMEDGWIPCDKPSRESDMSFSLKGYKNTHFWMKRWVQDAV